MPTPADDSTTGATAMPSAELERALDVALRAARIAMRLAHETPLGPVETKKNVADVVTEVDKATERAVRDLLGQELPEHTVVGEEYGGTAGTGPTWYCDPVDGTTNLAAGLPWTSFSLSLAVGRQPLVGVVADPWRDEILHAVAGRGCFRNGEPVARRDSRSLAGGVVLTDWAGHEPWPGMLAFLAGLSERMCTSRVMGSSTLTLAHIAAGRCEGAVVGEFHPEDHLAATLLGAEAGLAVWDESGTQQPFPASGGVMVAVPAVAEELFALWQGDTAG